MKHRGFVRNERGQVIPIAALMMIVIIGFAALIIDGGRGYVDRRDMQGTADAGALSGAVQLGSHLLNNSLLSQDFDMGCAVAAATNQVVQDLPGTSAPGRYTYNGGGKCPTLGTFSYSTATDTSHFPSGTASLGNGYTMAITADLTSVQVTLHHQLGLTFGIAAGFGPSISPGATATAVNGAIPFALILFHTIPSPSSNCPNSNLCDYRNLVLNGTGSTLLINATAGNRGDALSNEGYCLGSSSMIDMSHSGDSYAYVPFYVSNKNGGQSFASVSPANCGTPVQILNDMTPPNPQPFPTQLSDPSIPNPGSSLASTCSTALVGNCNPSESSNKEFCLEPGVYTSISVTKGKMILMPGLYKITGTSGGGPHNDFFINNGGSVETADHFDTSMTVDTASNATCPSAGSPVAGGDASAVSITMTPEPNASGNAWDANQLLDSGGDDFDIHSGTQYNHVAVYIEHQSGDPCTVYGSTDGGYCGTQVVNFGSGTTSYHIKGLIYGYADNMQFYAAGTSVAGIGQVFAWTMTVSGNAQLQETYDPNNAPFLQGLLH